MARIILVKALRTNGLRPIESLSDRGKRYRANKVPLPGPKCCGYCGSERNLVVDHIDGYESNVNPSNLMRACKACNTRKGILFARLGLGRKTVQRNPAKAGRVSMKQYGDAIKVMRGVFDGDVSAAMATIQAASPSLRSAYTSQTWKTRRALYGDSGRAVQSEIPF